MRNSKFSESQIIKALKENQQGRSVGDISRELGIDNSTFYYWRKKYGGMEQQELKRLKELEAENNKLKQMYADVSLDNKMLKDILSKKVLKPSDKRFRVKYLVKEFTVPILRACKVVGLSRSMWYYQSKKDDIEVIEKLTELSESYPTRGFDEYYHKIRREGLEWNRKRVLRVYREMKLSLRRKHKKRLVKRVKQPLETPKELNVCWSMDFMSDALTDGRKLRVFNIIDDCNREALAIEAGLSYPSRAVVEILERLKEEVGTPKFVRCDNGPEFISKTFMNWCKKNFIEIKYTQPGKPMQNGYIESFNRFFREDILDAYYFNDIHQLQKISDNWREDYNFNHPHKSLGNKSPKEYMPRFDEEFKFFIKSDLNNNYLSKFKVS